MDNLRVGIIGMGKMGLLHSGIFNGLEGSKVTAICEKDKMMFTILNQYLKGINVYRDYEKMFKEEELDIAVITTPVFLHKSMIEYSIEQEVNIFVEKPLCINFDECKSILNKKNEYKTLVGYCRRFMGTYNFAKELIDKKILGKINSFQAQIFVEQVFDKKRGFVIDCV